MDTNEVLLEDRLVTLGDKFDRLTVIGCPYYKSQTRNQCMIRVQYVTCLCKCGETKDISCTNLVGGRVKSCGCYRKERQLEAVRKGTITVDGRKKCSHCLREYDISHFAFKKQASDGYCGHCRTCARDSALRSKYGISLKDYETMLVEQGSRCACCNKHISECLRKGEINLHVDHDHTTGKVRGLLCCNCNTLIGKLKDDIDTAARVISYLIKEGF